MVFKRPKKERPDENSSGSPATAASTSETLPESLARMPERHRKESLVRQVSTKIPISQMVARLQAEGPEILDKKSKTGWGPLHVTTSSGDIGRSMALLNAGADVDSTSWQGCTALHHAALSDAPDMVEMLINKGGMVNAVNMNHETPLHYAAWIGNVDNARVLVQHGADVECLSDTGMTPLLISASRNKYDMVLYLLECGADVLAALKDGKNSLHLAIESGNVEAARLLIANGADTAAVVQDGRHSLHFAVEAQNGLMVKLLLDNGVSSFIRMLDLNHKDIVELARSSGAPKKFVKELMRYQKEEKKARSKKSIFSLKNLWLSLLEYVAHRPKPESCDVAAAMPPLSRTGSALNYSEAELKGIELPDPM